ncbi:MAG: radical SAM protein [Chloroflexi bacterium]|nr:radical SAM protein [Chloroflexota bacterium]
MSVDGPSGQPESTNAYEQIVARSGKTHRLLSAHWELTYRCNERCTHCYLDVFAPNAPVPGELTTQECFQVIDQLAELGALNLTLSGGEILVRRDFFDIAEYARSKRFLLRLFTNGILIKDHVADRIAALHPYAVELSVYSTRPEVHDGITRVPRSLELTTRALRLLHERGIRTIMKTPLMRETVADLPALKALAQELGARFKYDITITPKDTGGKDPLKHRMTYDQLVALMRDEIDPALWVNRQVTPETRTCGIASKALALDPYGNVYPCLQVRSAAGNVREKSVRDIWEQAPLWQDLGQLKLGELPVCRTCELNTLCVRCHGLAQMEDGSLRAPALVNCREALARRQALIEKGALPPDYAIPAHLREYATQVQSAPIALSESLPTNFILLSEVMPPNSRADVA